MALTIIDLRVIVREKARPPSHDTTIYPDALVDRNVKEAMDEYYREVRAATTSSTITLTAQIGTLPAMPAGWAPEYNLSALIIAPTGHSWPDLKFVDYPTILRAYALCGNTTPPGGRPCMMAFSDANGDGLVFPNPDLAYTINLWYWTPRPEWTDGQTNSTLTYVSGATGSTFTVADEALRVIAGGAAGFMQETEPENAAAAAARIKEFRDRYRQIKARAPGSRDGNFVAREYPGGTGAYGGYCGYVDGTAV